MCRLFLLGNGPWGMSGVPYGMPQNRVYCSQGGLPKRPNFQPFQMEYEAIFTFVDECDRRIRAAHRQLEKTSEENAKTTNLVSLPAIRFNLTD